MQEDKLIIFGKHSAIAAVNNNKRDTLQIFINETRKDEYKNLIPQKFKSKIEYVNLRRIEKLCGKNSLHQGIAVIAQKLPSFTLQSLLKLNKEKSLVIILDQINDPYNFGNILRSSKAFGVNFVISQAKYSPGESSSIAKVASGALEDVPICSVSNLSSAIEVLKNNGYFCYCLTCDASQNANKIKFEDKSAIIIGSEGEGVRKSIIKKCDFLIKIPMHQSSSFDSINVSNAAAIVMNNYFNENL